MSSTLSSDFFLKIRKREIVSFEFRAIIYLSILCSLGLLCKQSVDSVEVASGSPLPGVKMFSLSCIRSGMLLFNFSVFFVFLSFVQPQQLEEAIKIPKETIEVLKNQVFGFDTFFITSQDPYEVSSHLLKNTSCSRSHFNNGSAFHKKLFSNFKFIFISVVIIVGVDFYLEMVSFILHVILNTIPR